MKAARADASAPRRPRARLGFFCALCAAAASLWPASVSAASSAQAARSPAALVPAGADAALLLDGARGAQGLRAFLSSAARFAPSLDPAALGEDLARQIGQDLLAQGGGQAAGLAPDGFRAVVAAPPAYGLSAPVLVPAKASRALRSWVAGAGSPRAGKRKAAGVVWAGAGAQLRAGKISSAGGRRRLFTASGRGAVELVLALERAARSPGSSLARSAAAARALADARAPAALWVRGSVPVHGVALALDAQASGLHATGLLLPDGPGKLFAGATPDLACPRGTLLCASASLGPAAGPLLLRGVRELVARALPRPAGAAFLPFLSDAASAAAGPAALRVDRLSARELATAPEPLQAFSFVAQAAAGAPPPPAGAALPPSVGRLPDGLALLGGWPLCARAGGGAASLAAPCTEAAPAAPAPGADPQLVLAARFDTAALDAALARLSPLDALRSEAAAGAYAAHLLWGPLLARAGPAVLQGRAAAGGAVALDLRWPLPGRETGLPARARSQ